ncbi:hypothetical protein CALCODRAFT_511380 [Calocera cornea HHB12733]|uniref:DUF3295 domain-containing protein n=1 Tax=Calocera cornea HHB12733 TaxID=1353952 RepID=A0A165DTN8_9BASI|nr:hypothetical protein CALCODRAFT_511380 [Calocera cornea HHB12733]
MLPLTLPPLGPEERSPGSHPYSTWAFRLTLPGSPSPLSSPITRTPTIPAPHHPDLGPDPGIDPTTTTTTTITITTPSLPPSLLHPTTTPKGNEKEKEMKETESMEHTSKRNMIFFIQSPGRDTGSSYSDSHDSPESDENAGVQNGQHTSAAVTAAATQPPTAEAPGSSSPAPRQIGPVRTKSRRQIHPHAMPTRAMKHTSAKTRVLGNGHQRPAPPVQRQSSEKKLASAPPARRADSDPLHGPQKAKAKQEPVVVPPSQAVAAKPVLPPGVGSPQVTRRREPEPAPAVRGSPSSSPAVLKAPPPTPASVMNTRPLPAVSPSRLRVPPPTPVTVMQRNLPPPPPLTVAPAPQVANHHGHPTSHRSPPPPASPVDDADDDDDSEWFDSDAETEDEEAEAEAARQAELQRAAEEAQRQREMFSKRRTPSRVELVELGRIGGGLSRLFHPDPNILQSDLYRTQSAVDASARSTMTERLKANKSAVELRPNGDAPTAVSGEGRKHPAPLKLSKSSAALPTVQNQSVTAGESVTSSTRGWILKGRPEDDEESETDVEEPEDLGMSRSIAQQRLEAFASRSRSRTGSKRQTPPTPLRSSTEPPPPPQPAEAEPPPTRTSPTRNGNHHQASFAPVKASEPEHAPPQPIDFAPPHPYNQRIAPQNTPRTAARIMMADELSESVRRQLLWMRASRATGFPNIIPRVQSQDDVVRHPPRPTRGLVDDVRGSAPQPGHGGLIGDVRGSVPQPEHGVPAAENARRRSAVAGLRPLTPLERTEQKQANALQRTRSLAEGLAHHDFHIAGW